MSLHEFYFSTGSLPCLNLQVFAVWGCYTAYVGGSLQMFQNILLVPSTRVKHSKKKTGTRWKHGYVGDGVGSGWLLGSMGEKVKRT